MATKTIKQPTVAIDPTTYSVLHIGYNKFLLPVEQATMVYRAMMHAKRMDDTYVDSVGQIEYAIEDKVEVSLSFVGRNAYDLSRWDREQRKQFVDAVKASVAIGGGVPDPSEWIAEHLEQTRV